MSNKTKIIILSVIFSIFLIAMIIIIVMHNKTDVEEPQQTEEHNYAVNDIKDSDEETEQEETTIPEKTIQFGDSEITHVELLTHEQNTDRTSMLDKLNERVSYDIESYGKVITEEILDRTDNFDVFIEVTFEDGTIQTYVCSYDPTNMHSFLRCVSLEEWEYYNSDENAG